MWREGGRLVARPGSKFDITKRAGLPEMMVQLGRSEGVTEEKTVAIGC